MSMERAPPATLTGDGPTPDRSSFTVLVPLDGSSFGESALPHARALSQLADGEVHLLTVLGPERGGRDGGEGAELRLQIAEAETYLEGVADPLREAGIEVTVEVRRGRPAEEIVRTAGRLEALLVALAARPRREEAHLVSRGVAHAVMASGVASVLVARGDAGARVPAVWREASYGTVLGLVDGSSPSDRALSLARDVARIEDAEVLSVQIEPGARSDRRGGSRSAAPETTAGPTKAWTAFLEHPDGAETAADGGTGRTRTVRCPGIPQALEKIVREVEPDLVVFAAHGAGEAEGTYGHCARWLLAHVDAPVLALQDRPVRPDDAAIEPPEVGRRHRPARPGRGRRPRPQAPTDSPASAE